MTPGDINLRITLGEMSTEDSFWVTIPIDPTVTVHDLLDTVFPDSAEYAEEVRASLDVRANPDLPEMYQAIQEVIFQWRNGASNVDFKSPSGSDVLPSDPVSRHITASNRLGNTFQLVLHQRLEALIAYERTDGNRDDFMQWMQGCVLIYFLDKHHYPLPVEPDKHSNDWLLLPIADELQTLSFIAPSRIEDKYVITHQGRGFIGKLISETESYIRRFDLFSDILPGKGLQPTVYGSSRGLDLRVQIFEAQGIDQYRAVFLLRMYDGTLDCYKDTWHASIHDPQFFNRLLEPVLDHSRVDGDDLDLLIEHGLEHIQKTSDATGSRLRSRPLWPQSLTD